MSDIIFPSIILPPYQFPPPPHHFAPWKWFNDLCYLPMSRIILPPLPLDSYHFAPEIFCTLFTHVPYNFAPVSFPPPPVSFCPHRILPPGNCFMIYTISPCPVSFCPLDSFCPYLFAPYHFAPWKWFNDLHYLLMSRIILPPVLDFVFILIKSPLQLKLMTGAHPVTVAPLVNLTLILCPCHKMAGEQRCRVVKLLACGARGPGFDSRPRHLNFQRLDISCFQVKIWLKDR